MSFDAEKFESLWKLKPEGKSEVYVYNKETKVHDEKQIFRSYRSYLLIPPLNKDLPKSYMHDGVEPSVPNQLLPYLKEAWFDDDRYNQMVINWYEPEDYIESHRDCDNYMVDDYLIRIVSLDEGTPRKIVFKGVVTRDIMEAVPSEALPIYISQATNRNYRHSVGPGDGRRISITFRMLDEKKIEAKIVSI